MGEPMALSISSRGRIRLDMMMILLQWWCYSPLYYVPLWDIQDKRQDSTSY